MLELLAVVVGVILLWKFAGALNSLATSARVKAEVLSEEVIADCTLERTENFERFKEQLDGKTVYSHNEVMSMFKVDH